MMMMMMVIMGAIMRMMQTIVARTLPAARFVPTEL